MDQGPVDAGPSTHSEYEVPASRPESPAYERPALVRNVSTRQANSDDASNTRGVAVDGVALGRSGESSSELLSVPDDPPLYPRVGATAEELRSGDFSPDEGGPTNTDIDDTNIQDQADVAVPHRIHKFTLYETSTRYWIAGADITDNLFKLLRVDRTSAPGQISIFEDNTIYERQQLNEVLTSIDVGNKATGGLRLKCVFWGLLGFIRFTESYYMLIITKRQQVAMIGGHYVYQVDGTELIPLSTGSSSRFSSNRNAEETRFLGILSNLDLTRSFYFSYSYNITRSLQHNIIRQRTSLNEGKYSCGHDFNGMFVWNSHLLKPARNALKRPHDWCLPIIHGFIDQAALDIFGRSVYITIVGRRSRFFAGARFLKRGINDLGYVANDVETEQIVSEMLTTSFHAPGPRLFTNPTWTSYVHHRGSIPLYWTQDNTGVTPKPNIDLNLQDPFYQPAALHFDNLFERYGCPIYVLNLIKSRERTPRESKLLYEFQYCVEFLNQSLPDDKKILYKAFDMSRASKTRGGDVIGNLEVIAEEILNVTGFFHNGDADFDEPQVQNGIARTNCVDCLDRTNAAQFVIGKCAFGKQLQALGVLGANEVEYDTDAINLFTHMFHDHGDTIAVQYGGSHLVNTMATYRKLNHWQSHSRDMVESFKRYYHNSFLDNQRQEAYNLFLGNYIWAKGQPMLWDLVTDYYLHHSDPRGWLQRSRRDYFLWYTPAFLQTRELPLVDYPANSQFTDKVYDYDDYWMEYYRPYTLSSFLKMYPFRMNNTNRYLPDRPNSRDAKAFDFSPFKPRLEQHRQQGQDSPDKRAPRKGVKIIDPSEPHPGSTSPRDNLRPPTAPGDEKPSILRDPSARLALPGAALEKSFDLSMSSSMHHTAADKAQMHLWTLNQFHTQSLNPSVTEDEAAEYSRYITHPLTLPLVTSSDLPSDANIEYVEYVQRNGSALPQALGDELRWEEAGTEGDDDQIDEQDMRDFREFVASREEPLTVTDEDGNKKRYKAYRQWLRGKSLFKQSKVDPEYVAGV
jgi:hypothetical protein